MANNLHHNDCRRTILIVEDERDIRESLQSMLELEGYDVLTASNGKEALDLLRSTELKPRLVFLDMMMPVMDGASFLNILVNDTILAPIPVYIHSANTNLTDLKGARGILRKPASIEAIMKLVESYCD